MSGVCTTSVRSALCSTAGQWGRGVKRVSVCQCGGGGGWATADSCVLGI